MTIFEKIDLIKASILVADFWGTNPDELLGFYSIDKVKKKSEWNKIAKEVSNFSNSSLKERIEIFNKEIK